MYLTFDEYTQMGGDTLEETAFEQLEFEARAVIDYWTFNRLTNETEFPEAVKRCMFKLITLIHGQQQLLQASVPTTDGNQLTHGTIMSESNDGVSVSYNTLSSERLLDLVKNQTQSVISQYLGNVRNSLGQKVLYRGIYPNE